MILQYKIYNPNNLDGPPLVMVHGFLCAGSFYSNNITVFEKHHPIITIDLAGFGDSAEYSACNNIKDMALDVLETIANCGLSHYYLLGHSMGGMVALQCGVLTAEDNNQHTPQLLKLIAYATNSSGDLGERFESFEQSKVRLQNNYQSAKADIVSTWFIQGKSDPNFESVMQCSEHVSLQSALNAIQAMQHFNITYLLQKITAKILIIGAQYDRTYTPKSISFLRANLPNANYKEIANTAHNAHIEDPSSFAEIVLAFLASRPQSGIVKLNI
jgi:pimeloyl-ACP methyl ester carboxylesterase